MVRNKCIMPDFCGLFIVQVSYFDFPVLASSRAKSPFSTAIIVIPHLPGEKTRNKKSIRYLFPRDSWSLLSLFLSFLSSLPLSFSPLFFSLPLPSSFFFYLHFLSVFFSLFICRGRKIIIILV